MAEESSIRKFFRDAILTVLGGFVLEPTLKRVHIDVAPYLQQIWFAILLFLTLDGLKRAKIENLAKWRSGLKGRRLMISYFLVVIIGALVAATYWRGLGRVFPAQRSEYESSGRIASLKFTHTALILNTDFNSVFVADEPVKAKIVYENTGPDTAKGVIARGRLEVLDYSAFGLKDREEATWQQFRKEWLQRIVAKSIGIEIGPHSTDTFEVATAPISEQDAIALRDETKFIYFFGAIKWKDGSSGEYETDMCSYFRPSVKGSRNLPALWYDCRCGHNAVRAPFQKVDRTVPPRLTASVNVEVMPVVDLGSKLVYYTYRMVNVGNLPARNCTRITEVEVFPSGKSSIEIDQLFAKFEERIKNAPFGKSTIGVLQEAKGKAQVTGVSFQDMLDIQGGLKRLYAFTILKYQDDNHELLQSKSCISYSHNGMQLCEGHNEAP